MGFRISDLRTVSFSSFSNPKSEIRNPKLTSLGCASRLNVAARSGLAPLELVLSLFFLLLMMALIINFGTIASWRVRGNTAARFAVWRTLGAATVVPLQSDLRTGGGYPNPSNWQTPATMGLVAPGLPLNANTVGQLWSQQDLMQPALRGPSIVDPASGNIIQMGNQQYLEMVNQAVIGTANLTKQMPLLPKLRKSYIKPLQPVLNSFWRFADMSPQTNYWAMRGNDDWRLKQFYLHEPSQSTDGSVQNAYMQYQMDDQMIQQNPGIPALLVLDRDPELFAYYKNYQDVYPSVRTNCVASSQDMQLNYVLGPNGVIVQIEGRLGHGEKPSVPYRLAELFLEMYNGPLQAAKQQQPPDLQTISQYQPLVDQLTEFITGLK